MGIVFLRPLKIIGTNLLPAAIFSESRLGADEMVIKPHSAGQGFVEPHSCFGRIFAGIGPADCAGRVSGGGVGGEFSIHHGAAHPALQAATPDRGIIEGAALIIGLKPDSNLAEAIEVRSAADIAAKIGKVKGIGVLFFGDSVVLVPQLEYTIIKTPPVGGSVRRG